MKSVYRKIVEWPVNEIYYDSSHDMLHQLEDEVSEVLNSDMIFRGWAVRSLIDDRLEEVKK